MLLMPAMAGYGPRAVGKREERHNNAQTALLACMPDYQLYAEIGRIRAQEPGV